MLIKAPLERRGNKKPIDGYSRDWMRQLRTETEWAAGIERDTLNGELDEADDTQVELQIETGYVQTYGAENIRHNQRWALETEFETVAINEEQLSANRRQSAIPSAEAVWQEYEARVVNENIDAMIRANAAWKEYEDHMEHERALYESMAAAAWLEQEHRIENDWLTINS